MLTLTRHRVAHRHFLAIALAIGTLFAGIARGQLGESNPTGIAGQFNGNVTTGCSYDPFTGNATRSVTDIVVAGAVGEYPLAFTRTMNSRFIAGLTNEFGAAGNWRHSYQWTIDTITVNQTGSVGLPQNYYVNYPDGRRINFSKTRPNDPDFRGPDGVRDRFEQLATGGTECYVQLPDGGKVWFHAAVQTTVSGTTYTSTYTFSLKGIIDPYGQITTITYPADGSMTITEPAGRYLKIFYRMITKTTDGNLNDVVVNYVQGSDGRKVQYTYIAYVTPGGVRYTSLTSVTYFNDANLKALYTYQNANTNANDRPLIATCTDPLYDGPMWKIAYDFAPNGTGVVPGQLLREKHPTGAPVSTLMVTGTNTRMETRGDNPAGTGYATRTFTYYSGDYKLKSVTDFKGVAATQTYDTYSLLNSVIDRRSNETTFIYNFYGGSLRRIHYPNPEDGDQVELLYTYGYSTCPDPNNQDAYNPYYLYADPAGVTYFRDASKRVIKIVYPDTDNNDPTEEFTYNARGQVLTHKLRNGSTESWTYDTSGKVTAYWDAAHPTSGKPTAWYQYDSYGRVSGVTESRGTASGDKNYTTLFAYNTRGQLIKLTHPDGKIVQYVYNSNGTLASTTDELSHVTTYTYDDYKRLRSVTTPLRASGDTTPRTTYYFYDQTGTGDDYSRTAAIPTKVVSPGGKIVTTAYDENLRTMSVTAVGDSSVPDAKTGYTYDPNGNVRTVKDPNGQSTGCGHDLLLRRHEPGKIYG